MKTIFIHDDNQCRDAHVRIKVYLYIVQSKHIEKHNNIQINS